MHAFMACSTVVLVIPHLAYCGPASADLNSLDDHGSMQSPPSRVVLSQIELPFSMHIAIYDWISSASNICQPTYQVQVNKVFVILSV